jgi:hypothetical protein
MAGRTRQVDRENWRVHFLAPVLLTGQYIRYMDMRPVKSGEVRLNWYGHPGAVRMLDGIIRPSEIFSRGFAGRPLKIGIESSF